jgi:hypothetical protein
MFLNEGGKSGVLYPDTGLGIGIDGGVPWGQVIRIYEVANERVVNRWNKNEWERHIERVKDNPEWYPENSADPLSKRVWVIWMKGGRYYHHDLNTSMGGVVCGYNLRGDEWTDQKKERLPLRDVKNGTAAGKNARGQMIQPCPKCWREVL